MYYTYKVVVAADRGRVVDVEELGRADGVDGVREGEVFANSMGYDPDLFVVDALNEEDAAAFVLAAVAREAARLF